MRVTPVNQEVVEMLRNSIATVCRSALKYKVQLNVEGLLGITVDKKDIFLVNINESLRPCIPPGQRGRPRITKRVAMHEVGKRKMPKMRKKASPVKDDSGTEEYEESIDGGKEAVEATKSAALITPEEDEDIPLDIKVESQEGDDTDARGDAQMDDEEGSTAGADDEDEDDDDDNDDDAAEFSSNSLMKVEVEPVDSAQPSTSGTAGDEAEKTEEKKYFCDVCGYRSAYRSNLMRHLKSHTPGGYKRFQCTRCYRDFTSRDALKEHKLQPHDPIICPDCQEQFVTRRALWNHKIQKHNPGNLGLPCDLCDRRFVSKTALEEHINTHTGIRSFVCFACSKGFLHRGSLDRHMKRCVDAEDYTCSRCSKSFSSATVLKDHIEGVHDNIAKWACKHCGKKFTWRHSRIRHEEKCNVHNADVE